MDHSSSKNIKVGVVLTYITQFLSIGISFIYVPIMLGILGKEEYGLYALVLSIIAYLNMSEMGIGTTATRYNARYLANGQKKELQTVNGMFFVLYLGIAVVSVIAGSILYGFLDGIYHSYSAESVSLIKTLFLLAMVNTVISFVFKIFNAIIIAHEKFIFIQLIALIQTILGPAGMLIVLHLGMRAIGMIMVTTIVTGVFGLVQMIYCFSILKVKFVFHNFELSLFKTIFSFTAFVFINTIAHQLFANTDKIIVSIMMNGAAVAVFAIVLQLEAYYYTFSNVISNLYMPRLTKMVAVTGRDNDAVLNELVRTGRIQTVIAGLIYGGFVTFGRPFILQWLGSEYESAYLLVVIVLAPQFIGATQSLFTALMQAMNLHKMRALIGLGAAGIKVVLTIIFVNYFGLIGCAVSYTIAYLLRLLFYNIYYKRRLNMSLRYFWIQMLKFLVPTLIVIVLLYFGFSVFTFITYVEILIGAILYSILFLGLLWIFALDRSEKQLVTGILKQLGKKIHVIK